ncbi:MAG: TSUP family transporter [Clostridiaceae bacterium]|nr:TSUP family transporter [Clostridiaceae bacterium]
MTPVEMLLIVCPLIFLASFIDSIAGGGGLISIPAYLLTGIPTHMAFGSNKLSASAGTAFATLRFYRHGKIHLRGALISAALALAGAALGARLNLLIDAAVLKKIMLVIVPAVAVFVLIRGRNGKSRPQQLEGRPLDLVCALAGFVIGMYDGLVGPGTGSFLIVAYTAAAGYDHVTASGNAKVVNLASNLASLAVFIASGQVLYWLALPAAACGILGGWTGSKLAIQKGRRMIQAVLILVMLGIIVKLAVDVLLSN